MHCTACGNQNLEDHARCIHCGASLGVRCGACLTLNSVQAKFCWNCGEALVDRREDQIQSHSEGERSEGFGPAKRPSAERRQLTVLFCDLVGSTSLSERLDPEDLVRVLGAFQKLCNETVYRYGGHIAQYLGDGVLIYFGHPVAHEDDAQLALRTALGIQFGVKKLSQSFKEEGGSELSVRIGIHTGEVIVGRDQLAVGETPNIAARTQGLAEPNTIVMTANTHRLVKPFFKWTDLGEHRLKGLERQIRLYVVVGETGAQTRIQAVAGTGLMPLEGRKKETGLLMNSWRETQDGTRGAVLIRGEPGIGKSRLIEAFKAQLADESYSLLECYCLAYDQLTAFAPISHLLRRVFDFQPADSPQLKLAKLRSAVERFGLATNQAVPLLAPLVSLTPDLGYSPLEVTPVLARHLTLETLTTCLLGTAKSSPVLFIVEDLHWMDPSSLELLGKVINQQGSYPLLMLLTCRPEFQAQWEEDEGLNVLTLPRLSQEESASLATHVAHNRTLPVAVLGEVVNRTDGVPLFVEELTKTVIESGVLRAVNGSYELKGPLPPGAIPSTVQDSLMARLDRLGSAKILAQLGATIGRDFRHDVLLAVAQMSEVEVARNLARLLDSDLVSREGISPKATYSFRHALVQEVAYQSLLKSTRVLYHERIASVLFERFPEIERDQPELLAQHYTAAGSIRQAVTYWQKAGSRAMERSANEEAFRHLTVALDLLPRLPEDESRRSLEIALRVQLGLSLTASSGYGVPQVGEAYQRARELCHQLGNTVEQYPALRNLCTFYTVRDDLQNARELAEQCLRLGEETQRANYLIEGYQALGYVLSYLGELKKGTSLLEKAVQEYRSRDGKHLTYVTAMDPAVASLGIASHNRWVLGDFHGALQCNQEAIELAEAINRPFDVAYAHAFASMFHILRGEFENAVRHAEVTVDFSQRHGLVSWEIWGSMQRAIAKGRLGDAEEAVGLLTHSLDVCQSLGAEICTSYFLGELAEVYRVGENIEEALSAVERALAHAQQHGELWYVSNLYRIRGDLLTLGGKSETESAEQDFYRAVEIAQNQEAKLLELKGAMRLHELCLKNERPEPSRTILLKTYKSFPLDAGDMPDLQEARELLE